MAGWLIVLAGVILAFSAFLLRVYPFLAGTHRVDTNVLVVEGRIHEYAIQAAADEFRSGAYQRVFTTDGPVVETGGYINDLRTSASVGADLLRKAGVPDESLQTVPSRMIDRDRTYSAAEDTHARRTRLLFQKAFGKDVQVGIIAVANVDYPANQWWHYSEGLKDVVSEFAAYLYARFLFCR